MAKKAQGKMAKTGKATKPAKTAKTAKAAKPAAKGGVLAAAATRVGRTLGRAARGVDKVTAAVKKSVSGKPATKKPKVDPEVQAAKAKTRESWKSQAEQVSSVELTKHGSLVDERARVRATTGMSWSNRKPR